MPWMASTNCAWRAARWMTMRDPAHAQNAAQRRGSTAPVRLNMPISSRAIGGTTQDQECAGAAEHTYRGQRRRQDAVQIGSPVSPRRPSTAPPHLPAGSPSACGGKRLQTRCTPIPEYYAGARKVTPCDTSRSKYRKTAHEIPKKRTPTIASPNAAMDGMERGRRDQPRGCAHHATLLPIVRVPRRTERAIPPQDPRKNSRSCLDADPGHHL